MKKRNLIIICAILVVVSYSAGLMKGKHSGMDHSSEGSGSEHVHAGGDSSDSEAPTVWTCSMHPQIKLPEPGLCPICQMDLIPLKQSGDEGPTTLTMSEGAKKLAEIETVQVEEKYVTTEIRMVGKVAYNERKVNTLSAWIPGRIDGLYVDYTGIRVAKDDHLALLYSPNLLTAQQELLEAKKRLNDSSKEKSEFLNESNLRTYESTRKKLLLWGLNEKQVETIEVSGKTTDQMTIYAPNGGVVVHKHISEGDYVKTGSKLFTIADLSELWLLMDAYESDLPYLHYAQKVKIETEAFPGEVFRGTISFIHPELNERSRTVKVRVNVENPDLKLKPGMFVRAVVYSRLAQGGKVISPKLAGKWISPMHPEIIKDEPGDCDICGMKLVKTEDFGYTSRNDGTPPVVIPVTAVLKTGKRAVVYVELKDKEMPTFVGREIVLGPRAGNYYIVESGLERDEWVVTNGNFKLDSALQIQAKPSMMNTAQEDPEDTPEQRTKDRRAKLKIVSNSDIKEGFKAIYKNYFAMQVTLAEDNYLRSKNSLNKLFKAVESIEEDIFPGDSRVLWVELNSALVKAIHKGHGATDIEDMRRAFEGISKEVIEIIRYFGHDGKQTFYVMHCPMAFNNRGASWLQNTDKVNNSYFGEKMLMCGEIKEQFSNSSVIKNDDHKKHKQDDSKANVPKNPGSLKNVYDNYFDLQKHLASDDYAKAKKSLDPLLKSVESVDLKNGSKSLWEKHSSQLIKNIHKGHGSNDIKSLRKTFEGISNVMIQISEDVGHTGDQTYYMMHCSMAFNNKGASWLQDNKDLVNPYFGASMLKCGAIKKRFKDKTTPEKEPESKHNHEGSEGSESSGSHK